MKILFLEAAQNYGGARISTIELAQRLSSEHEVLIVDFYGSCQPFVESIASKNLELKILDKRDEAFIIRGSASRLKNFKNILKFFPHWLKLRRKIRNIIEASKPDVIMINNYKTLSVVWKNVPREGQVFFFARGWFLPKKINRLKTFLLKATVDKYLCVSEATRHALFCGDFAPMSKLFVVQNAIEERALTQDIANVPCEEGAIKVLHAGGFLAPKGQHISIEAAKYLKEKNVKFKLILAGIIYKGDKSRLYYESILRKVKEYNLEDEVLIITGQTNVIPYFRACDIVIHPSATEGLPRVIMEAMFLKKPVIANPVGGVTDFILNGFTGIIANYDSPKDYALNIELLSKNQVLYNSISDNAFNLINQTFTSRHQRDSFDKALFSE